MHGPCIEDPEVIACVLSDFQTRFIMIADWVTVGNGIAGTKRHHIQRPAPSQDMGARSTQRDIVLARLCDPCRRRPFSVGVRRAGSDRPAYWVEHGFRRVQGHARSLPPTNRPRADHRTGLICRLTIGMRRLTLLECVVRWQLAQEPRTLTGLDAGNPKRTTGRPTAEQLLTALGNLPLTISGEGAQLRHHLTPRSTLQQRILPHLGLSSLIYTNLAFDSS